MTGLIQRKIYVPRISEHGGLFIRSQGRRGAERFHWVAAVFVSCHRLIGGTIANEKRLRRQHDLSAPLRLCER